MKKYLTNQIEQFYADKECCEGYIDYDEYNYEDKHLNSSRKFQEVLLCIVTLVFSVIVAAIFICSIKNSAVVSDPDIKRPQLEHTENVTYKSGVSTIDVVVTYKYLEPNVTYTIDYLVVNQDSDRNVMKDHVIVSKDFTTDNTGCGTVTFKVVVPYREMFVRLMIDY